MDTEKVGGRIRAQELFLTAKGVKPCSRFIIHRDEKEKIVEALEKEGLNYEFSDFALELETDETKGFSNKGFVGVGEHLAVYFSKDKKKAGRAKKLEAERDDYELGLLLGYPECCCRFFKEHKKEMAGADNDFVLPMVKNSEKTFWENNILLRYFDISILSHFPCSLGCENSRGLAQEYMGTLGGGYVERMAPDLKMSVLVTESRGVIALKGAGRAGSVVSGYTPIPTSESELYQDLRTGRFEVLDSETIKIGGEEKKAFYVEFTP